MEKKYSFLADIITSIRPYQWVKNVLVFAALFFSLSFFDPDSIVSSLLAFAAWCLISSSIYLLNDLFDRKGDSLHPVKRNRPIAAGRISPASALAAVVALLSLGSLIAIYINLEFFLVMALYIGLNVGYSQGLKNVVILDIMIVASGFLLRAVSGAFAIGVAVSPWLFICTLLLALLPVLGKRRQELSLLEEGAGNHRKSLEEYRLSFIDGLMFISASTAIVTYSLYTLAPETVNRFDTEWLCATTPLVIYGIFRYLHLVCIKNKGGDPTKLMISDKPFLINGFLWALMVVAILYWSKVYGA